MATRIIKASEQKQRRKRWIRWSAIGLAVIILGLFIAGLVLGLITANGFREFENFDRVRIHAYGAEHFTLFADSDRDSDLDQLDMLNEGFSGAQFSLLRGTFEGGFSNNFEFATRDIIDPDFVPDPEIYDEIPPMIPERDRLTTQAAIRNRLGNVVARHESEFVLYFEWDNLDGYNYQTITVRDTITGEDEVIKFDRARVRVSADPDNIVEIKTVYFYLYDHVWQSGPDQEHQGYQITPVQMRATPVPLVNALLDIMELNGIR